MKLTLPMPPVLNRMYRTFQGRMLLSKDGRQYKKDVEMLCLMERIKPLSGDIALDIKLYRPAKRGDIDAYFKGLFDALNGIAWIDDKQIVEMRVQRLDDKHSPRVEIEVTQCQEKP